MSTNVQERVEQLKGLLKIAEAATMCGVTTETLRNWDRSGTLVAQRHPLTGYRYYRSKDIEAFIKRRLKEREENS
ncbi:MerR family DNA-binding transcriptional regulator [Aporhodopirellula aestuarii]|uniref:MerR family DNA-binding transcriptional regulator n=1 Tax=Aporhodopirellula aestuarii TaxID=2950107 RepID=A0ABT0U1B2_9BACT|nr:MerR family DNA-binding transcriptional regulator [Aporhodopirellula aestuarii]MCM2370685.1 MerR family DNA-binding transcriptional regulator [Aporhodopirellula aestuarii]